MLGVTRLKADMRALARAFLALGLLTAASGAPGAGQALEPSKPWVLDYADTQCVATRDYGSQESPITLGFSPSANGENYQILLVQPGKGPTYGEQRQGSIDFGKGPIEGWFLSFASGISKSTIFQFRIPSSEMAAARSASAIRINVRDGPDVSFRLYLMPQLLDGLKDCVANLIDYWNVGGEKNGRIATPAKGQVRKLFSSNDYPAEALSRWQEGSAQFLLLINEKGRVEGCQVLTASGSPALDVMGCQVIRERAHFSPALDPKGTPVRSAVVTPPVTWRMQ